MQLGLEGKSVLVSAGSKGLGKASALEFAREGANVTIASRSEAHLKQAREEIRSATGRDVHTVMMDVTKAEQVSAAVLDAAEKFGGLDALIVNAGGPPSGSFDDLDDEAWRHAFELNLMSAVRLIRCALPYFRKAGGGRIVNITSMSIKQPVENLILSNVFRVGVYGMSKTLAAELAPDGILVNTVGPARIGTERIKQLDRDLAVKKSQTVEQIAEGYMQAIPMGRYGDPEEFARAVVFLGSFANTYITGQALLVDGGMVKAL